MANVFESVFLLCVVLLLVIGACIPVMSRRGQELTGWLACVGLAGLVIGAAGWAAEILS